jgi:hypothetical protein
MEDACQQQPQYLDFALLNGVVGFAIRNRTAALLQRVFDDWFRGYAPKDRRLVIPMTHFVKAFLEVADIDQAHRAFTSFCKPYCANYRLVMLIVCACRRLRRFDIVEAVWASIQLQAWQPDDITIATFALWRALDVNSLACMIWVDPQQRPTARPVAATVVLSTRR